jgi:type 2 lantibiotic biosynthesis protein LanM
LLTDAVMATKHVASAAADHRSVAHGSADTVPFEELIVGFVTAGQDELRRLSGECIQVLGRAARDDFERQLRSHLSYIASLAFGLEWYLYRFQRAPSSSFENLWNSQEPSNVLYGSFVETLRADGLIGFFGTYPVLARLMSQSVAHWADSVVEFCRRFERDRSRIQRDLCHRRLSACEAVSSVIPECSDRHFGGRTVTICSLSNGTTVVYKPRPVVPELAFRRFVDIVNGFGLPLDLRMISVVDCGTHGWTSFVPAEECSSHDEAARYFYRAGMLLCLAYVMAVSDIHYENVISVGEYPVLVDVETLLDVPTTSQGRGSDGVQSSRSRSVLNTGMLPDPLPNNHNGQDLSALGARAVESVEFWKPRWSNVNTDQMSLMHDQDGSAADPVPVHISGEGVVAGDYIEELITGFRDVYEMVRTNIDIVERDRALLDLIDAAVPRVLIRSTATYSTLQHHLLNPKFLKDGLDRSVELEWLSKPLSAPQLVDVRMIDVYAQERSAMEQLDVPHFSALSAPNDDRHATESEFSEFFLRERGIPAFLHNLARLDEEDLTTQLGVIRQSMTARFPPPSS